ncbi:hypothetical protein KTT_05980 [Tengunoibacter tsumagoiensis]|uniref:Uncharacterized protein n=1 Tax=Tengunoibacter tsumagoiensis TaxID=2014871 RepID=A0A401ZV02_9CHLR|nr:hypothetical protein KTT_05980 [Tengunoibacter tsumagoiensis]
MLVVKSEDDWLKSSHFLRLRDLPEFHAHVDSNAINPSSRCTTLGKGHQTCKSGPSTILQYIARE